MRTEWRLRRELDPSGILRGKALIRGDMLRNITFPIKTCKRMTRVLMSKCLVELLVVVCSLSRTEIKG